MISLEGLADDVRRLLPGAVTSRVVVRPAFDHRVFHDSSKRFNTYVSRLREDTGFDLKVSSMDGVAGGSVVRCMIVERLS